MLLGIDHLSSRRPVMDQYTKMIVYKPIQKNIIHVPIRIFQYLDHIICGTLYKCTSPEKKKTDTRQSRLAIDFPFKIKINKRELLFSSRQNKTSFLPRSLHSETSSHCLKVQTTNLEVKSVVPRIISGKYHKVSF